MKKLLAPVAATLFALSLSTAQADEAGGKIAAMDQSAGVITLEDGTAFIVSEGVSMEGPRARHRGHCFFRAEG